MFSVYKKLEPGQLKMSEKIITKSKAFFAARPERKVANVGVWCDKVINIRKNHIEEDANKELNEELP